MDSEFVNGYEIVIRLNARGCYSGEVLDPGGKLRWATSDHAHPHDAMIAAKQVAKTFPPAEPVCAGCEG